MERENTAKNLKKFLFILVVAALSLALITGYAATTMTTTENSETYNGITRTERTTVEIFYQDENGNIMDAEEGEEAFNAAKAAMEDTPQQYVAELKLSNYTDETITGFYLTYDDAEDWGENVMSRPLECDYTRSWGENSFQYTVGTLWRVGFVTESGAEHIFREISFDKIVDPYTVLIELTAEDGSWSIAY